MKSVPSLLFNDDIIFHYRHHLEGSGIKLMDCYSAQSHVLKLTAVALSQRSEQSQNT